MAKRIKIHIEGQTVTIKTTGYSGPACEAATRKLREAIGVVDSDTRTPEFYEVPQESHRETER